MIDKPTVRIAVLSESISLSSTWPFFNTKEYLGTCDTGMTESAFWEASHPVANNDLKSRGDDSSNSSRLPLFVTVVRRHVWKGDLAWNSVNGSNADGGPVPIIPHRMPSIPSLSVPLDNCWVHVTVMPPLRQCWVDETR